MAVGYQTNYDNAASGLSGGSNPALSLLEQSRLRIEQSKANRNAASRTTINTSGVDVNPIDADKVRLDLENSVNRSIGDLKSELNSNESAFRSAASELRNKMSDIEAAGEAFTDPETFTAPLTEAFEASKQHLLNSANLSSTRALMDLEALDADNPDQRAGARVALRNNVRSAIVGEVGRASAEVYQNYAQSMVDATEIAGNNQIQMAAILAEGAATLATLTTSYLSTESQILGQIHAAEIGAAAQIAGITAEILIANQRAELAVADLVSTTEQERMRAANARAQISAQERIAAMQARAEQPFVQGQNLNVTAGYAFSGPNPQNTIYDPLSGFERNTIRG